MTTTRELETVWKRIKVPPELLAAGWKLTRRDTSAPFAMINEKLDQDTGGHPDPQEAIAAARALMVEHAEAQAIASEGSLTDGERPAVLPLNLIDEGWRLQKEGAHGGRGGFQYRANRLLGRVELNRTEIYYGDPAAAVAEAIEIETKRQLEIEERERAGAAELDQAEQAHLLEPERPASGPAGGVYAHYIKSDTPAELLLELERIRTDGGTQQRSLFDQGVLEDYVEVMRADLESSGADHFPAVDVFFDGSAYWLADGFYRVEARRTLGEAAIPAHVREGSQRDAILFSLGANARHGLPRTPEDKRRAVLVMLRDPEWATWSDAVIAERVRVSVPLVRKLRHQELAAQEAAANTAESPSTPPPSSKRRGRDGRIQDTARIGKRSKKREAAQLELEPPPEASTPERVCNECKKELRPSDFRNAAGLCFKCAGMDQKRPRSKKALPESAAANEEQKNATSPTFAELGQDRKLKLSIYLLRSQPGRAFVSVTVGKRTSELEELDAAEVILPPSLLALIAGFIKTVGRTERAAFLDKARKKAPAPPARKAAGQIVLPIVKTKKKTLTTKAARAKIRAAALTEGKRARRTTKPTQAASKRKAQARPTTTRSNKTRRQKK